MGDAVGMAQSTVSTALPKVCDAILLHRREYIRLAATAMECYRSSCEFARIAELPNIAGSIDCTQVRFQSLEGRFAEVYRNRKGYFSLNVQTISDSNLKILDIDDDFLNLAIEQGLVRQIEQVYLPDEPNARHLARDRLITRLRERFP